MSNFKKMTLKNVELINIYAYINRTEKVIDTVTLTITDNNIIMDVLHVQWST